MVKINFNGYDYNIHPCLCGGTVVEYDSGMMACAIKCCACGKHVIHNGFHECLKEWNRRYEVSRMTFSSEFVTVEDLYAPEADRCVRLRKIGGSPVARRSNSPFERSIQASIIKALNTGQATLVRCRSADAVGHIAGDPDIYGSIGGVHVEIEVKVPGEEPEDLQWYRLEQWAKTGAACCWVTSKAQALEFQEEVLAGRCEGRILEFSQKP